MALVIKSESVIVKDNKILVENTGEFKLIGDNVKEGESLEDACKRKANQLNSKIKIIRPLNPIIEWTRNPLTKEMSAEVNIHYLAELE